MENYTIKYRTFDQLIEDVSVDFSAYALEGMIEPQQLIKVATRVNYDLGLRIHRAKEVVLDVEHNKVKLPNDFYTLNFAMLSTKFTVTQPEIQGTHIEEVALEKSAVSVDEYGCPVDNAVCQSDCGNYYQLIQKFKTKTVTHEQLQMIRIKPGKAVSADCPNSNWSSANQADIRDGWIYTSFKTGQLFINYQGALENTDGELLVVDHPLINEYYEYAIKQRILENMYMNGENVVQQMNLVEGRLRGARNNALSLVNTPNFGELKKIWEMNRKAQYHKYVNMFKSTPTTR